MNNKDKKPEEIFIEWSNRAKSGDLDAQYYTGYMLFWGIGVKKNRRRAAKFWREAAEHGHTEAQYWLGTCYDCGLGGFKENRALAIEWWRKSAASGHRGAMMAMVSIYVLSIFVGEGKAMINKEEALEYCQKAAMAGNCLAKQFLRDRNLWM